MFSNFQISFKLYLGIRKFNILLFCMHTLEHIYCGFA